MATQTISYAGPVQSYRAEMDATAGNMALVAIPKRFKRVRLTFRQAGGTADTGKVAHTGTEGAAIGDDHFPVASGAELELTLPGTSVVTLRLAGGTNAGFCHLLLMERA